MVHKISIYIRSLDRIVIIEINTKNYHKTSEELFTYFTIISPSPSQLLSLTIQRIATNNALKKSDEDLCKMDARLHNTNLRRISVAISLSPNVILDADLARE